ncbi:response regulator transcription factor [Aeromicrobium chenweiae]|uniref:DNA-binding response regulator n=1 Tax=Aeromicrobium chenweiae TaxID=2079793 RepID=A0A2S0WR52_9ACTN|nr:response regulator transcription factor [Aeromicrobium chenweiae]AWB93801.1 DNA-binding response regulator [Aeromicrobium chenweiae]TGN30846.1 response regulator transcription factor [Aeromicrobium chenweiae]
MTLGDRPHVLVVLRAAELRDDLRRHLELEDYDVSVAAGGSAGLAAARELEPDLVVLDAELGGMDGLEVCEHLRVDDASPVPIMLLTADGNEEEFARLTSGADDYVATPVGPAELARRIGSVLRRSLVASGPRPVAGLLTDGDLALNPVDRTAMRDGAALALTPREFDLLHFLIRHPGRAFRRKDLLHLVWGWEYADDSTVAVHVERVRSRVEEVPSHPRRLVTVKGVGYRWDPAPAS